MDKILLSTFLLTGCSLIGIRKEETPKYQVLVKKENMEIRRYSSFIVASTYTEGSFNASQNQAFKILAGYIFGKNDSDSKISMTAPVTQSPKGSGSEMSFIMPSKYARIEDLPKPKDERITFKMVEPQIMAAITFSGFWSEEKNQAMANQLKAWISEQGEYVLKSAPKFAGYDPPWTIPFLRRNEVLIQIEKR